MSLVHDSALRYLSFLRREHAARHHRYDEEMRQYRLMQAGDMAAVEESRKMWASGLSGTVSIDPDRNLRYLVVASITIATRLCIEGGLDEETAYNASDLYIQKMDACQSSHAIFLVHEDMITFFTKKMAEVKRHHSQTRPVRQAMDYIDLHLHEKISMKQLSDATSLSPSYLSTLFRKETGSTVTQYILSRRMEAASAMLRLSDEPISEIASILAFSSQSHFTSAFHAAFGMTPQAYRAANYRHGALKGEKDRDT